MAGFVVSTTSGPVFVGSGGRRLFGQPCFRPSPLGTPLCFLLINSQESWWAEMAFFECWSAAIALYLEKGKKSNVIRSTIRILLSG